MSEAYQIDEAQSVIWTRCWGVLCDEDVLNHQARLRADPKFRSGMSQLVDCTAVTEVTLTARMMLQMGQSTLFAPEAKRAYVVAKEVMFGLARMYEMYQGMRGHHSVRVFRCRAQAVAWLDVQDCAPGSAPAGAPHTFNGTLSAHLG
jgi:hypothetical protein